MLEFGEGIAKVILILAASVGLAGISAGVFLGWLIWA